jgi:peptide/nickel transport system permease protein
VVDVITSPALRSLGRVLAALALALTWGTALAWWTAERRTPLRPVVQALSIVPVFLMAHALVLGLNAATFAAIGTGWIDRPDWFALPDQPSALRTVLSIVILATASGALHETHAQLEEALVHIRRAPYIDAARARGAPVWRHVARNLVPPLAVTLAERAAFLAGSVVIVEKVLLLNGAGAVLWEAALLRDYDVALGIALYAAAFVGVIRLVADGIRVAVDPRLREAG